ncbi:hypothetical protein [Kibdelosporangium phytohabitans]|uniref:Uncharacterized protein n=1 Tax=Kibdelosporangium phytohabitans TaxID=860235 RepID=A0A0N9HU04_9PSEU|nr:hypothetical protein [Kibdelosporangium phytohabitans]ALG06818.1 hypothetical protein AOZ06_07650 [Kibdelosporangium phytohabitans]MBE1468061.1 hypothetical protein [Kibdelosporangium phytohabitans]
MTWLKLITAKAEAAVETDDPMESDAREGQEFLPTKIVAHYAPDGDGWRVSHVFIAGPVIRKRDGQLGGRNGFVWFSAAPKVATLVQAPEWAKSFAEDNLPGGAR